MVSVAAGLAMGGKNVFIYAVAPFVAERCYEQIKIDLAGMRLPVTVIGAGPGITYSSDGPTHHALEDIAVMRPLPGMSILNPADSVTAGAVADISYKSRGPVYVRIDKGKLPLLYEGREDFQNGLALLKKGRDLIIITTGIMVHRALKVAAELSKHSIDAGVVDIYRIKPLNEDLLLDIVSQANRAVTIEEHSLAGGIGSAVSEMLVDNGKNLPLKRIAIADGYCTGYGDRDWMHTQYGLDADSITKTVLSWHDTVGKKSFLSELTVEDFARLFGTTIQDISDNCRELIARTDFRYKTLVNGDHEAVLLEVLKKIDSGKLTIAGSEKKTVWENGWSENLRNFIEKDFELDELTPKYYRPGQPLRIDRRYARGRDPNFEYNFFKVLRLWLFDKYLKDAGSVYEFGCGPGHNLVSLAKLYPKKRIHGLDWASSAIELVNKLAEIHKFNIEGHLFDMFNPDESLHFEKNSVAITFGALEQMGNDYEPFLYYLIKRSPTLCINVEPFCELYDESNLLDYVAIQHHKKRNLLGNYLASLRKLESKDRIKIIKIQRLPFGGMLEDGWSYAIWEPKRSCEA
jgi:transketolase C-terminal domain/subunit